MLVPEIALTPQTVGRFQARFGDVVAVLHSGLGQGERHDEWLRLRTRRGARLRRSALGGVRAARRHRPDRRRRGARRAPTSTRATRATTPAPSPSAGPSSTGRCCSPAARRRGPRACTLTAPAAAAPRRRPPAAAGRDPRHARAAITRCIPGRGWRSPTSEPRAARRSSCSTAAAGRTSSPAARCGHVWMCPNCEVALVLHRAGRARPATTAATASGCPSAAATAARCRSRVTAPAPSGSSTSCGEAFGDRSFPVLRLDARHRRRARTPGAGRWRGSRRRRAGVLIGTQMVAKGHDFADVALGVVLDADADAAVPRLPCRGAHVRARHAARRARGRGDLARHPRPPVTRARPRADAGARRTLDRARRSARLATRSSLGELQRREALGYPPFAIADPGGVRREEPNPALALRRPSARGDRAGRRDRARARAAVPSAGPLAQSAGDQGDRPPDGGARGRRRHRCLRGRCRPARGERQRRRRPAVRSCS